VFDAALLASVVALTTPLLLAAMGELVSERAGVLNVGLEGMILVGAFFAFWAADATGSPWIGCLAGLAAGMMLASLMALLAVNAGAEQIVVGLGLNLLSLGLTAFLFELAFLDQAQVQVDRVEPFAIPLLSDLPGIGKALFDRQPVVYIAYLLVPGIAYLLYRTTWGLAIRAAGETPKAADTAGVSLRITRWAATCTAGALAGLAGAYLSVVQTGLFTDGMSAGRGYLALAAVIFGRWRPLPVLGACLVFGGADALQLRLQAESLVPASVWIALAAIAAAFVAWRLVAWRRGRREQADLLVPGLVLAVGVALAIVVPSVSIPSQLWLALPYLLALLALAGLAGRAELPRALGVPYRREATEAA
jgi:ABC-type uncharacterized transport system permease subunit